MNWQIGLCGSHSLRLSQSVFTSCLPDRSGNLVLLSPFDSLWHDFHTHQTEVIRVRREALAQAWGDRGGSPSFISTAPRSGSSTVMVNRAALFEFLKECDR